MAQIETFYDPATYTLTYVVFDPTTRDAIVIDPVLDYDPLASRTGTASADKVVAFVRGRELNVRWVLETHAHADHLSASQYLKAQLGAKVAIGEHIREVQAAFKGFFDLPADFATDGSQVDRLLADGETLEAGSLRVGVIATPGHTPACVTYRIDDAAFTGDALFIEDYGTGRCDFPRGSAEALYTSVHDRLYALPDATRVFVGHDYQPGGRPLRHETTIGASKRKNVQLKAETLLPGRDYGVMASGGLAAGAVEYAAGAFNGAGDVATKDSNAAPAAAARLVWNATGCPIDGEVDFANAPAALAVGASAYGTTMPEAPSTSPERAQVEGRVRMGGVEVAFRRRGLDLRVEAMGRSREAEGRRAELLGGGYLRVDQYLPPLQSAFGGRLTRLAGFGAPSSRRARAI